MIKGTIPIDDIQDIVENQNRWRGKECINMIASENSQSPAVRAMCTSDFMARYAEGHPGQRYYQGTKYIDQIEAMASKELKELLNCKSADVRPISGNAANIGIFLTFLLGGDSVIANSTDAGGHISHNRIGGLGRRIQLHGQKLNEIPLHFFPLTPDGYHTDVSKSIDMINQVNPTLIVLGRSLFLFPEPVKEFSAVCKEKKIPILYDAAHVFGLIAGGKFQNPLVEGADILTASTHKTFPGPQRGIAVSNHDPENAHWKKVDRGVFPGSSSNHHLHSLPALLVAIREFKKYGKEYAVQTVLNAKKLAAELDKRHFKVEGKEFGFTESHQVAVDVTNLGGGNLVAQKLENNNIIINSNMLFGDEDPKNPRGLRIGVQEMTRFGMKEPEMEHIADFMRSVVDGKNVAADVSNFRQQYTEMKYW
jgi:glycine hydroxymethyltransferase